MAMPGPLCRFWQETLAMRELGGLEVDSNLLERRDQGAAFMTAHRVTKVAGDNNVPLGFTSLTEIQAMFDMWI